MKNLRPFQILIAGSVTTALVCLIVLVIINAVIDIPIYYLLAGPLLVAATTYIVFHFLIKRFLTEKITLLYRSIRKGKFNELNQDTINIFDDVIENAEAETKKWAEEQSEEISKLKEQAKFRREFMGNLAHELKTPVFSIQGYILTLLEGGLEDKNVNRAFLERASKATERMTNILEDLDQLTRMEVDNLSLDLKKFDIVELIQDVFDELEIKAKKKKIRLRFSKDFDPIFVHADRNKIGQLLTNIIGNSISYGNEKGETIVRFYILEDIITIEVSDNGPGISDEDLPRIFERFYRVEKSRNRNEGGSGLGLAIAKKIIEAHGQTINVRSTVGLGSTFTFSLDKAKGSKK